MHKLFTVFVIYIKFIYIYVFHTSITSYLKIVYKESVHLYDNTLYIDMFDISIQNTKEWYMRRIPGLKECFKEFPFRFMQINMWNPFLLFSSYQIWRVCKRSSLKTMRLSEWFLLLYGLRIKSSKLFIAFSNLQVESFC